jgi:lipopolysaccharide export system ATP-binding protein
MEEETKGRPAPQGVAKKSRTGRKSQAEPAATERAQTRAAPVRAGTRRKSSEARVTQRRSAASRSTDATPPDSSPETPAQEAAPTSVSAILEEQARSILEVQSLIKVYGGRAVVDNVSFTVRRGEIIGLLGKNGAGKTTTFRMTIGMITADEGLIRFAGRDVTRLPMYKRARLGMGYLSQESSVFRGLTVEQNLNAILETTDLTHAERVRMRDELVTEFGLEKLRNSKAAVLSGGEKRRLEIARALVTNPKLILLDEPFSGVDPIAVSDIQQIIFGLRDRGISILLTDHNVRETLNTTDRSFIILDGRIIASGGRDEILSDKNARKHYLGERFSM